MGLGRTLFIIAILAAVMRFDCAGYCADGDESREIRTMAGSVTAVDTFDSTLTVKWQDLDLLHYDSTTFKIPEGMKFYKETDTVDIFEVNIGDPVTIEYYIDKSGAPGIVRMEISQ